MKFIHYALYAAPLALGLLHLKWPEWDSAILGAITLAMYIAINTHKPGAAAELAKLRAEEEKVQK